MFALFFSLYYAMFTGQWTNYSNLNWIYQKINVGFKVLGTFVTSIFGDNTYTSLDEVLGTNLEIIISLVAFVLALITSIGIVVVATKGVKKAFGIFFMGIRRW